MPRRKTVKKISNPPVMKGFKPFGLPACKIETIHLSYEEYESLRLVNYSMLDHEQASMQMEISRPTFTRIYNKALKQITKAFVEGKVIQIDGGNFEFDNDWFRCKRCHRLIEGAENHLQCEGCPAFGKDELIPI